MCLQMLNLLLLLLFKYLISNIWFQIIVLTH